jgi:diguanylate cyclase (GGDEF)-like protein
VSTSETLTGAGPAPAAEPQAVEPSSRPTVEDARERQALLRVAAAASGASGLDDVLELAAEQARTAIGAASLSVSRWERADQALRTLINIGDLGPGEDRFPRDETYSIGDYPQVGEMVRSGKPYFNAIDDDGCHPAAHEVLTRLGKSSDLGVPILVEGEVWGEVWATKAIGAPAFRAEDVSFLEAIAGQFATAIARAELFSKVSRLAYEDPLTGLPNRRALDERLERALHRARAADAPVAVLLCDLDKLKEINDTRGHEAGDRALARAGEALVAAAASRPGAFVARLSGDEFCVLLEGQGIEKAVAIGGAAVAALGDSDDGPLSISCGAAISGSTTETSGALLNAADTALYAAKRRGGGQVCSAAEGAQGPRERRRLRREAGPADAIAAATNSLIHELDGGLRDAPVLDRLEAVAGAYTEAMDLAAWSVSVVRHGSEVTADVSIGDNRDAYNGIRVETGTDVYPLSEYPLTEQIVRAGTGHYLVQCADPGAEPTERQLLERLGYTAVLGVAAADENGVWLLELYDNREADALAELAMPLRLAATAALPPPGPRHKGRRASAGVVSGSELSLSVARRLDVAASAAEAAEIAAEELHRAFDCHIVHVVRLDGEMLELVAQRGRGLARPGWRQPWDRGLTGRCVRDNAPVLADDVRRSPEFRGTEATREVRSELAVPVRVAGQSWGVINLEDTTVGCFDRDDVDVVEAVAAQLGSTLRGLDLYDSLERAYVGTAEALSAVLEAKDPYTAQHSDSIAERAVAVGRRLEMNPEELRVLRYAAAFHDIGKIAIPRSVLNKPGPLTATERLMIEQHTVIGERILSPIEFLHPALPLVRHAHERWDGGGYPDGLAGEEIPLGARVLFVCDAHDAMTTDRPYRQALAPSVVLSELREGAGSQFDPAVVEALLGVLGDGPGAPV